MMMMMSSGMMSCSVFLIIAVIVVWQWPKISDALNGGGGGSPTGPGVALPTGALSSATWNGHSGGNSVVNLTCPSGKYANTIVSYYDSHVPEMKGLKMVCNDGTTQAWERRAPSGKTYESATWSRSDGFGGVNLLNPKDSRHGLGAMSVYDTTPSHNYIQYDTSKASDGVNNGQTLYGDAAGSQASGWPFYCPSGQKVNGMNYNHDGNSITGMTMYCG